LLDMIETRRWANKAEVTTKSEANGKATTKAKAKAKTMAKVQPEAPARKPEAEAKAKKKAKAAAEKQPQEEEPEAEAKAKKKAKAAVAEVEEPAPAPKPEAKAKAKMKAAAGAPAADAATAGPKAAAGPSAEDWVPCKCKERWRRRRGTHCREWTRYNRENPAAMPLCLACSLDCCVCNCPGCNPDESEAAGGGSPTEDIIAKLLELDAVRDDAVEAAKILAGRVESLETRVESLEKALRVSEWALLCGGLDGAEVAQADREYGRRLSRRRCRV